MYHGRLLTSLIIAAGLAELASAYPSSGGQYHFAFMVSSVKTRAFAAFITGWLSTLAWCLTTTSAAIYCGMAPYTSSWSNTNADLFLSRNRLGLGIIVPP